MGGLEGLNLGRGGAGPRRIHNNVPLYGICQSGNATLEAVEVLPEHNP